MGFGDIIEAAITAFIVIILVVVMAPVVIEIGKATSQEWYGYFGAGVLVIFAVIVVIGMALMILKR